MGIRKTEANDSKWGIVRLRVDGPGVQELNERSIRTLRRTVPRSTTVVTRTGLHTHTLRVLVRPETDPDARGDLGDVEYIPSV